MTEWDKQERTRKATSAGKGRAAKKAKVSPLKLFDQCAEDGDSVSQG